MLKTAVGGTHIPRRIKKAKIFKTKNATGDIAF